MSRTALRELNAHRSLPLYLVFEDEKAKNRLTKDDPAKFETIFSSCTEVFVDYRGSSIIIEFDFEHEI